MENQEERPKSESQASGTENNLTPHLEIEHNAEKATESKLLNKAHIDDNKKSVELRGETIEYSKEDAEPTSSQQEDSLAAEIEKKNENLSIESKREKIQHILKLKQDISLLIGNVRHVQRLCEKHEHDNEYLQDYIGTLLKGN